MSKSSNYIFSDYKFLFNTVPLFLDKPICSQDLKTTYGVALKEIAPINCSVNANPSRDLTFRWTFNSSSELTTIEEGRFSQSGTISSLNYIAYHERDYGTILCWARNEQGEQEEPCVIHIIPAGQKYH